MRFDNTFTVAMPPAEAWPLLLDVPRIAPCLPGARLIEALDDRRYRGEAAVKIGPVELRFGGEAQLTALDPASWTARVVAKGADAKGRGSAAATVDFALVPESAGTRVNLRTDLTLVGAVAQYGRASGLIKEIASQLIGQFATNLAALARDTVPVAPAPDRVTAAQPAQASPTAAAPTTAPMTMPPAPPPAPAISGLSLLWSALKRMIGRWIAARLGHRPQD